MRKSAVFVSALICLSMIPTRADDWPQWRGPNRDGLSKETGLLKEWPKGGPKLLWENREVGSGYSSVAVVGDRVYTLANDTIENETVKVLSVKDGKEIWSTRIGKVGKPNQQPAYPAARSTPTVDGDFVYALGSDGDLACLEKSGGKVRWQKNIQKDFGGDAGRWAYAESPLVDGEVVACTPGGTEATILGLNKKTGEVVWKSAVPGGDQAGYASLTIVDVGGIKQYVQFLQKGLVGVNAKDGAFLWRYERPAQGSPANIPTPVVWKNYVYAGAGMGGGGLVKLDVKDGKLETEPLYFEKKMPTAIGGAIKVGDNLYGTGRELMCLDFLTGKPKWENPAIGAASILFADGRLYLHGENGQVALVEATPDAYREKGRFTPPNPPARGRSQAWAYPALSDGRLYIRDIGVLWCFDVKGK